VPQLEQDLHHFWSTRVRLWIFSVGSCFSIFNFLCNILSTIICLFCPFIYYWSMHCLIVFELRPQITFWHHQTFLRNITSPKIQLDILCYQQNSVYEIVIGIKYLLDEVTRQIIWHFTEIKRQKKNAKKWELLMGITFCECQNYLLI
jgi:hypothetical protein